MQTREAQERRLMT